MTTKHIITCIIACFAMHCYAAQPKKPALTPEQKAARLARLKELKKKKAAGAKTPRPTSAQQKKPAPKKAAPKKPAPSTPRPASAQPKKPAPKKPAAVPLDQQLTKALANPKQLQVLLTKHRAAITPVMIERLLSDAMQNNHEQSTQILLEFQAPSGPAKPQPSAKPTAIPASSSQKPAPKKESSSPDPAQELERKAGEAQQAQEPSQPKKDEFDTWYEKFKALSKQDPTLENKEAMEELQEKMRERYPDRYGNEAASIELTWAFYPQANKANEYKEEFRSRQSHIDSELSAAKWENDHDRIRSRLTNLNIQLLTLQGIFEVLSKYTNDTRTEFVQLQKLKKANKELRDNWGADNPAFQMASSVASAAQEEEEEEEEFSE